MNHKERFAAACNYPGLLDPSKVTHHLKQYLAALGMRREVVQINQGWELEDYPPLKKAIDSVLDDFIKRNQTALDARAARAARAALDALAARAALAALAALDALDARDALDALDARDARAARDADFSSLKRFTQWCLFRSNWWWSWDLSWISTTYFGAVELKKEAVAAWSLPILEAFCNGCWLLFWTEDTVYWIAKPTVHVERTESGRRLHNDRYAALECDIENLYFWHGVLVPAFVVTNPEWITVKHIDKEENAEVRRVMIERYGQERYLIDGKATEVHRDDFGILYRKELAGDEPMVMVKVVNSTPEADGSFKDYFLRVPPDMQRARQAVAWTFDVGEEEYEPVLET